MENTKEIYADNNVSIQGGSSNDCNLAYIINRSDNTLSFAGSKLLIAPDNIIGISKDVYGNNLLKEISDSGYAYSTF